jgi:hypothetical protein
VKVIVRHVEIDKKNQKKISGFERTLLIFCALGTILILTWVLKLSNYGIDFTDEGFYLVWIANPYLYSWSATQFGFVYHFLFLLLNGDIASLRQANILITFGLSWALSFLVLGSLRNAPYEKKTTLHITALGLATASLFTFDYWLPTPSYNSLAFQALLVASIGLMLPEKTKSIKNSAGWILTGVGGWLAFMAKPSTALALGIGVLFYLIISRKFSLRMFFVALSTALLLLLSSALLIDGSIINFTDRLITGFQFGRFLGGGHTLESIVRMDTFTLGAREIYAVLFLFFVSLISLYLACSKKFIFRTLSILSCALFLCVTASFTLGLTSQTAGFGQFQELIIWGIVFSIVAVGVMFSLKKNHPGIASERWSIALLFLVMPYIYAFGTNGNYWQTGGNVAIFWLFSGLMLLSPFARTRTELFFLIPLILTVQSVTATLLQKGLEFPYRQTQALRLNDTSTEIGMPGSILLLSNGYAKYVEDAKSVARRAGFITNTPVIDMTGQSPGILYALRAENIGQAWTIGGYSGSSELAKAALNRTTCEKIASAWILFESDGPRSIPLEVLPSLGADFPKNYTQMGSWQTAEGAGGYPTTRVQYLYAPATVEETFDACYALREKEALLKKSLPVSQAASNGKAASI